MIQFDRQIVVGMVFDLSAQHHTDGQRYIDAVKAELVDFAVKLGLNCGVYVAHPDRHVMPRQQGESVAGIFSYIEPPSFRAYDALLQATEMIVAQEADEKYVILITDRYKPSYAAQYHRSLVLNKTDKCGCKFMFLGIGDRYDQKALKEFAAEDCWVEHLTNPGQVGNKISEFVIIGV